MNPLKAITSSFFTKLVQPYGEIICVQFILPCKRTETSGFTVTTDENLRNLISVRSVDHYEKKSSNIFGRPEVCVKAALSCRRGVY